MAEEKEGCVKPARGPLVAHAPAPVTGVTTQEVSMTQARVGREAPDFEASAYHGGKFSNVKLSDHKGKWIVLCFYPGDFTFV